MRVIEVACCLVSTLQPLLVQQTAPTADPLCGIHSVYAGAVVLGLELNFGELLKPEFVGSEEGSSLAELQLAAERIGLHSIPVTNLSLNALRWSTLPIILHTKTESGSSQYNHFLLFLGVENGRAVVFDGPRGARSMSFADLASQWDGKALVLSREEINFFSLACPSWISLLGWLGATLAVSAISAVVQRQFPRVVGKSATACFAQACGIILIAIMASVAFHLTSAIGFIAAPEGVRAVRAANAASFLPKVGFETVRRHVEDGSAVLVDARGSVDFDAGHLPGAINVPAPSAQVDTNRALPQTRGRPIVVYCESPRCPYSLSTAQALLRTGHKNVMIYEGGWKEWTSRIKAGRSSS